MTSYPFSASNNVGKRGNPRDRAVGNYWEGAFIRIAELFGWRGWQLTPRYGPTLKGHDGGTYITPDVWLMRDERQLGVEIKHKTVTRFNCYGLEVYRADSLVKLNTFYRNQHGSARALYVIHDWQLGDGFDSDRSLFQHWRAAWVVDLQAHITRVAEGDTYYKGAVTRRPIQYYPTTVFAPLTTFLW